MEVFYCSECRARVSSVDMDEGRGASIDGRKFCQACARKRGLARSNGGRRKTPGAAFSSSPVDRGRVAAGSSGGQSKGLIIGMVLVIAVLIPLVFVALADQGGGSQESGAADPSLTSGKSPADDPVPPDKADLPEGYTGVIEPDPPRFSPDDGWHSLIRERWNFNWIPAAGSWKYSREMMLTTIPGGGNARLESFLNWEDFELGFTFLTEAAGTVRIGFREKDGQAGELVIASPAPGVWHRVYLKVEGSERVIAEVDGREVDEGVSDNITLKAGSMHAVEGKFSISAVSHQKEDGRLAVSEGAVIRMVRVPDNVPPVISDVKVEELTSDSVLLVWTTNERASSKADYWTRLKAAETVAGLCGEYYQGINFEKLALTRVDETVNYDWGTGRPASELETDNFSIRWTGMFKADRADTYTFVTATDDGVRLWVDGKLIIDKWEPQSRTEHSGSRSLAAGQHPIRMEFHEIGGSAVAELYFENSVETRQIIPGERLSCTGKGMMIRSMPVDASMVKDHRLRLSGLRADTVYYYRIYSKDPSGNSAGSEKLEFRTPK